MPASDIDASKPDLWVTDGTSAGTKKLAAVDASGLQHIGTIGPRVYLRLGANPTAVTRTDGSTVGTIPLGAAGIPAEQTGPPFRLSRVISTSITPSRSIVDWQAGSSPPVETAR